MKKLLIGLLVFGLTTQFMFSQEIELAEVRLDVNYKYLDAIESQDVAVPVKILEKKVAFYDVKNSDVYSEEFDKFHVTFIIPEGQIVAAYDKDGKILRTIERFKNITLPVSVRIAVFNRFPDFTIVEDFYKVDYKDKSGIARKQYKVKLKNGDKMIVEKFDEDGDIL